MKLLWAMTRTGRKRRAKVVGMRTKRKIGQVQRDDSGGDSDEETMTMGVRKNQRRNIIK